MINADWKTWIREGVERGKKERRATQRSPSIANEKVARVWVTFFPLMRYLLKEIVSFQVGHFDLFKCLFDFLHQHIANNHFITINN